MSILANIGKYKKVIALLVVALGLFFAIGFVSKRQEEKAIGKVNIKISNQDDSYFINEKDILALMTAEGSSFVLGNRSSELSLREMEKQIQAHPYVKSCQIYRDLMGNLVVEVEQNRPLARIFRRNRPDAYITEEGEVIPVSDRYTARRVLLTGTGAEQLEKKNIKEQPLAKDLLEMLHFIHHDTFWKAQVAEIEMDQKGELKLYTQVSKQVVEFGSATDYEKKFQKLMIFYKDILPKKEWNGYERVNVKYQDQIVCE